MKLLTAAQAAKQIGINPKTLTDYACRWQAEDGGASDWPQKVGRVWVAPLYVWQVVAEQYRPAEKRGRPRGGQREDVA